MKRWIWCLTGMVLGLILLVCAALVPAHWRAIDLKVIERAGQGTPSLVQSGRDLVKQDKIGAARMVRRAARLLQIEGHDDLGLHVARAARLHVVPSASADPLLSDISDILSLTNARPVIESLAHGEVRRRVIAALRASSRSPVQEVLKNLTLTNLTQFSPVNSPAGQPWETAVALAGVLLQTESISSRFRDKLEFLSKHANGGGNVSLLETVYLDLFSLGKRLDWNQLTELIRRIDTTTTLQNLAGSARASDERFPLLYAAAILLDQPEPLAVFVEKFPESSLDDLATALSQGRGSLTELMRQQKRIYSPPWRDKLIRYDPFGAFFYAMLPLCLNTPWASFIFRSLLFLLGSSALALGAGSLAFTASGEDPVRPDRSQLGQTIALALSVFLVIIVASEPFLVAQTSPKVESPLRVRLPMVRTAAVVKLQTSIQPVMTLVTLTSLIVFFVLQALIYIWCLAKISEIRRQPAEPRLKLRLLDNEEHLFDAGLYLGFVGTIISLILVSMGIVKPSIMAAYSSTSFGIIFVSILKIFHLRPLRRQLILESEDRP